MVPEKASTDGGFCFVGEGAVLEPPGTVHGAQGIWIGRQAVLCAGFRLIVTAHVSGERPNIIIGDLVRADAGLNISAQHLVVLEKLVWCGTGVTLTDLRPSYRQTGLAVIEQGMGISGSTLVGEGSYLGANCVIEGPVRVGKGCVVGAGCVVRGDVPDYSVVSGNPARISEMFDTEALDWIPVRDGEEVAAVLRRRRERPLLSVCIPTYNRSRELAECLDSVLPQTSAGGLVEVCVADNASDDDTSAVLARYASQYPQLRITKHAENIGAERNFQKIVKFARGVYVKLHGDDDYFLPHTLQPILHLLLSTRCRFIYINVLKDDGNAEVHEGLEMFLRLLSQNAGFISAFVAQRQAMLEIPEPDRFIGTNLSQIYWQFAILRESPRFCIYNSSMFRYAYNPPRAYNFGEVNIRGYLQIVRHFVGRGLSENAYAEEKKCLLDRFILPRLHNLILEGVAVDLAGVEEIFTEHYRGEPYFAEYLAVLRKILVLADGGVADERSGP